MSSRLTGRNLNREAKNRWGRVGQEFFRSCITLSPSFNPDRVSQLHNFHSNTITYQTLAWEAHLEAIAIPWARDDLHGEACTSYLSTLWQPMILSLLDLEVVKPSRTEALCERSEHIS